MKIRFAAALLTMALPVLAQEPAAAENLFYKAYWLERGERNFAEASTLYQQFLEKAPEHRLAKKAATMQFELLTRTGKTKEAEAFAQQYKALIGDVAVGAPAGAPEEGGADRPRGEGRGGRGGAQGGADAPRGNPQERLAELKKQLEEAKAAGDDEQVQRLERQIARLEQMGQGGGQGGGGQRGQGGPGGGRGAFGQPVKFAEMTKEQIEEFKTQRLERMAGFVDRMRENGQEERAKQMEDGIAAVKKALDENKLDEAQKAYDKLTEGMRGRRGGGG